MALSCKFELYPQFLLRGIKKVGFNDITDYFDIKYSYSLIYYFEELELRVKREFVFPEELIHFFPCGQLKGHNYISHSVWALREFKARFCGSSTVAV